MPKTNLDVIIVAAGSSSRMGLDLPKPFIKIANKPILWYSIQQFLKVKTIGKIVVVVGKEQIFNAEQMVAEYFPDNEQLSILAGGETRQHSVINGLHFLNAKSSPQIVAIHDAARPFMKISLIKQLLDNAQKYGGAAPGIRVVDTIKVVDSHNLIKEHLIRNQLIAIQTPQVFKFHPLYSAFVQNKQELKNFTDDTELFTFAGHHVKIISGDQELFKITFREDLVQAEKIAEKFQ
ncbi:MAG: 2-C-methyl-D-erythritol 4-phosphate cytidylyltransferase [Spirochaetes bacterium]|nr:2-C-methyl-D-erythritol 4-phosphate cytidylyltransferase [Spirochaetota bacterium]